jgi:hypothetical protein
MLVEAARGDKNKGAYEYEVRIRKMTRQTNQDVVL